MAVEKPTMSLRLSLILLVVVPLSGMLVVGGWVLLGTLETKLEARLEEDIALIARTLQEPMARAIERKRENTLDRTLQSAFEFGRVYGVYVYDNSGELISGADSSGDPGSTVAPGSDMPAGSGGDYRSVGGEEVYSYFIPLSSASGQSVGMLQVTRQASEIRDYIATIRKQGVILLGGMMLLFVGIILLGHHAAIGRPLHQLASVMRRVADGDEKARAASIGPQEIRTLGHRFNLMLDGIAARDVRIANEREHQLQLREQLRESERLASIGRLAAGVAHELGTPLSVMDGHAQKLLHELPAGSAAAGRLQRMRDAAARMSDVVEQLLGFGRGSAVATETISLRKLVALAAADIRSLCEETNTGIEVETPQADAEAVVNAEQGRLREVLSHLLKNAVYAAAGGNIRIGWSASEIRIEDSGPGVPAADRHRIFEPFYTTKPPGMGSGLGLAVVHGILADFDARIDVVDSELGGAAFRIRFPAGNPDESPAESPAASTACGDSGQ